MRYVILLSMVLASFCYLGVLSSAPSESSLNAASDGSAETSNAHVVQSAVVASTNRPVRVDLPPQVVRLLQDKVKLIAESAKAGNCEVMIDHTHPRVVQIMGGREQSLMTLSAEMAKLDVDECVLKSVEFHEDPTCYAVNAQLFAFVPVTTVAAVNGYSVEDARYFLAIKDNSVAAWKFVDVSKQPVALVKAVFPDYPTTAELPRCHSRILQ